MEAIEAILKCVADLFFVLNRRSLLRRVGDVILGEEFRDFAVLEMADVSMSRTEGFLAERIASFLLGWCWGAINWFAAFRAYRALRDNRNLPVRIVFMTLLHKDAPKEVWDAFFERNPEASIYQKCVYEQLLRTGKRR